uniref:Uncharacterized protein n=1 Tax=Trichuris muris TaxID=70415 RepID=A0A5S6QNF7_TRIMR
MERAFFADVCLDAKKKRLAAENRHRMTRRRPEIDNEYLPSWRRCLLSGDRKRALGSITRQRVHRPTGVASLVGGEWSVVFCCFQTFVVPRSLPLNAA